MPTKRRRKPRAIVAALAKEIRRILRQHEVAYENYWIDPLLRELRASLKGVG